MIIQIYAFTKMHDVIKAISIGVDHIGFVAGKYGLVHGELDFSEAHAITREIGSTARSVALTMSTDIQEIMRMADAVQPDIVHISSETEEVGFDALADLKMKLGTNIRVMKAIGVLDKSSIDSALKYSQVADMLLLDTKLRNFPGVGATGQTHDWNLSREIVSKCSVPVILAGGLTPSNVQSAIAQVKPWGVDSNTSTNFPNSPYLKDMDRVFEFIKAVRAED